MLVLGIESSCDETAAAVLSGGSDLLSSIISNQIEIHSKYGGVVPEIAGRCHAESIHLVIQKSLDEAGITLKEIDLMAVTMGPGLVTSLLVGLNTAKAISYALQKPLIGVNHLEGHLLAIFLEKEVVFPFIALTVSGGHTEVYRVNGFGQYKLLGQTRDDAAGESFDKVAKMLKLGYPGGPLIEKMAQAGNRFAHRFPRAFLETDSLDFSFSGLKTSVRNILIKRENNTGPDFSDEDIAACFQDAVIDVLSAKLILACKQEGINRCVVTGGVAANKTLRTRVLVENKKLNIKTFIPKPIFCTDNAAMIACAGYYKYRYEKTSINNLFTLDADASLKL
jgi:N6-L-threonylcarbamoyladenine synthase